MNRFREFLYALEMSSLQTGWTQWVILGFMMVFGTMGALVVMYSLNYWFGFLMLLVSGFGPMLIGLNQAYEYEKANGVGVIKRGFDEWQPNDPHQNYPKPN